MVREGSLKNDNTLREIENLRIRFAKMSEVSCRVNEIWDLDAVLQVHCTRHLGRLALW